MLSFLLLQNLFTFPSPTRKKSHLSSSQIVNFHNYLPPSPCLKLLVKCMEWCYESGGGEELVTRDLQHAVSECVQLSDRWTQWGICGNENYDSPNKYFVGETESSGEIHFSHDKFSDEVEMDLFSHETDQSSVLTKPSAQIPNSSGLRSVFREDRSHFQRTESSQNDGDFMPEWNAIKAVDLSEHSTIDRHCGNTEMWDFSLSSESEHNNKHFLTSDHPLISEENAYASALAQVENVSPLAERDSATETMSVEESLLLDFELVMKQMSEKTRYCFRDALYRLAKNSETPSGNQSGGDDDNSVSIPCEYESSRDKYSRSMEDSEVKTNTIDRTVASLMFSNMNFSLDDHHQQT